jgi:hypothetical protein
MAFLGPRGDFQYLSTNGTVYKIRTLNTLAAAGGLTAADGSEPRIPIGMTPRHVWVEATVSNVKHRKKIIMAGDGEVTLAPGTTVTIDGVAFVARGYVGEKFIDS